jgi:hypothetical protein
MKDRKPARASKQMHVVSDFPQPEAKLGREIQAKIGQQLRAMYDDVVNQGVPDRFVHLLNRLDAPAEPASDSDPAIGGDGKDKP